MLELAELRAHGLVGLAAERPLVLEIGFGRGELLLELAAEQPGSSFLGAEVASKRVEKMARRVERARLDNLRLVRARAEELLAEWLPPASVACCWINFPDPWPKRRHQRRRLISSDTALGLARVLESGGRLYLATDHEGYADAIAQVMRAAPWFENAHAPEPWSRVRPPRRQTHYEAEFLAAGRSIAYFEYVRRSGIAAESPATGPRRARP